MPSTAGRLHARTFPRFLVVEPPGSRESLTVVRVVETRLDDVASRLRCVHEAAVTDIDADVRDIAAARDEPEEHQVAGAQFARRNTASSRELRGRGAWHDDAFARVDVADEAAAV